MTMVVRDKKSMFFPAFRRATEEARLLDCDS
jgi:hypothetical protein